LTGYGGKFDAAVATVFVAIHDMAATLATGVRLSPSGTVSTRTFGFGQQLKFTAVTLAAQGKLVATASVPPPDIDLVTRRSRDSLLTFARRCLQAGWLAKAHQTCLHLDVRELAEAPDLVE
jgi:hypothetical protein